MAGKTTPWVQCESCEDFVCVVHGLHVWECDCPPIEWWAENDADPYSEVSDEVIERLLEVAPVDEDAFQNGVMTCDCA